jgi:ABC-type lipoprotein export system ATPase subunit
MQIEFKNVLPKPLADIDYASESLWKSNVVFQSGKSILLNASSGKGKTTFVHSLMGLRSDFSGEILIENKNTKFFTESDWVELRQRKIDVVFQDLQLFHQLTIEQNLKLKAEFTGTFDRDSAFEKLAFLGLKDKWDQKCGILSMGQQQRVAIVRALIQPFEWLVMDEPFSHLDKGNSELCLQLINQRCKQLNAGFILTALDKKVDVKVDYEVKL